MKRSGTENPLEGLEELVTLWKNAEEDLPDLIDARARLGKLR